MATFPTENSDTQSHSAFADGITPDPNSMNNDIHKLSGMTKAGVENIFPLIICAFKLLKTITKMFSNLDVLSSIHFTTLSSIFNQLTTHLKHSTKGNKACSALLRYQDSELVAEAAGVEELLFTFHAYLGEINDHAEENDVIRIEDRFPHHDTVKFMGKLKAKAHELLMMSDTKSAQRAAMYINLYSQLATVRTLLLGQTLFIKQRRGFATQGIKWILAMIVESEKSDLEVVSYITETTLQKAVFLSVFNLSKYENVLHFLRIRNIRIPKTEYNRVVSICNQTDMDLKFKMRSNIWGSIFASTSNSSACKFQLEAVPNRELDNIFYIRSTKWSEYYIYIDNDKFCYSVSKKPGPNGQWKVVPVKLEDNPNSLQYILSPVEWPERFLCIKGSKRIGSSCDLVNIREKGIWKIVNDI